MIEAAKPSLQQAYDKAATKLREWFARRLDDQSLDIARLYRVDRDRLLFRLRTVYEQYLVSDPTFVRAKITGANFAIDRAIDEQVRSLARELDANAVENLKDLMGQHEQAVRSYLKEELAGVRFQHLPYPTQNVLNELTTGVVSGGTFFDHMFHVTDGLKAKITNTVRSALISGPERDSEGNIKGDWFGDMRAKLLKDFGVDKLAEPKGPAYSSVKIYKNEARRQWNLLQRELGRRSGASLMWYAELDERSSPGCVARHGMLADELDDYPPRHMNSVTGDTLVEGQYVAASRMSYAGQIRKIKTTHGRSLSVTPYHPVLTARGMVAAGRLNKGDQILSYSATREQVFGSFARVPLSPQNEENRPARIDEIFESLSSVGVSGTVRRLGTEFHGDAQSGYGDIDVVAINRELLNHVPNIETNENVGDFDFVFTEHPARHTLGHDGSRHPQIVSTRVFEPFTSFARACRFEYGVDVSREAPPNACRVGVTANLDSAVLESLNECETRNAAFSRQLIERLPGSVLLDEIVEIRDEHFVGHVYDLQTVSGVIVANGLVVSNCRCTLLPIERGSDVSFYRSQASAWLQQYGYTRRQAQMMESDFDPSKHPRDKSGKFDNTGGEDRVSKTSVHSLAKKLGVIVNEGPNEFELLAPPGHQLSRTETRSMPYSYGPEGRYSSKKAAYAQMLSDLQGGLTKESIGFPWGGAMLKPAMLTEAEGILVPRLTLPLVAVGHEPPRVEGFPDAVVMRTVESKREIYTTEGWQPLKGKGKWCETQQGFFLDSPEIGPTWTPRKRRLPLDLINRWPKMRNITWAGLGEHEAYAVRIMDQTEANATALGIMPEQEWLSGEDIGNLVKQTLAQGVLSVLSHPHLAVAIVPVDRQIRSSRPELSTPVVKVEPDDVRNVVSLSTGAAVYARDNFDGGLLAPYQRVAVVCFEPDGNVWAVRPRGLFFWALPGGHIEKGEEAQDAARREMEEETGVKCTIVGHLGVLYRPWSTTQMFLARRDEPVGAPLLPEEIDAASAIPLDNLDAAEQTWLKRRWDNITAARVFVNDRKAFEEAFDSSKHPRDYHGKFTVTGGSRKVAPEVVGAIKARIPAQVKIVKITKNPEYTGEARPVKTKFGSFKEYGDIGENIVAAYLQQTDPSAHLVPPTKGWKAVDGVSKNEAFDVKTGLISVGTVGNRQWRFTWPTSDDESALLKGKSAAYVAKYNESKGEEALKRKIEAGRDVSSVLGGRTISPAVWGVILQPDTKRADLYHIPGWHMRTGWGALDNIRAHYVGTVHYELPAGKKKSLMETEVTPPPKKRATWLDVPEWAIMSLTRAGILDETSPQLAYEYARSVDAVYWDTFTLLMTEFGDNEHGH